MTCRNCECPFHELEEENLAFSTTDLNCLVTDAVKEIGFRADEVLFTQGQSSSSLYSVSQGTVKITCHSADGREQIVGLSSPGKLLVGLQSLDDDHYQYSAFAATDVRACKIQHRPLLAAVRHQPDVAIRLISAINAQLAYSRSLMLVMGQKCAAAKIASFIMLMAPRKDQSNDRFTLPFSRNDLAEMLGLSEETVCRQMASMKRHGVIYAPRGKMQVKDWGQLRGIAEGTLHIH